MKTQLPIMVLIERELVIAWSPDERHWHHVLGGFGRWTSEYRKWTYYGEMIVLFRGSILAINANEFAHIDKSLLLADQELQRRTKIMSDHFFRAYRSTGHKPRCPTGRYQYRMDLVPRVIAVLTEQEEPSP